MAFNAISYDEHASNARSPNNDASQWSWKSQVQQEMDVHGLVFSMGPVNTLNEWVEALLKASPSADNCPASKAHARCCENAQFPGGSMWKPPCHNVFQQITKFTSLKRVKPPFLPFFHKNHHLPCRANAAKALVELKDRARLHLQLLTSTSHFRPRKWLDSLIGFNVPHWVLMGGSYFS